MELYCLVLSICYYMNLLQLSCAFLSCAPFQLTLSELCLAKSHYQVHCLVCLSLCLARV